MNLFRHNTPLGQATQIVNLDPRGGAAMPGVAADSLSELDLVWCLTESLLNPLRKSRSVHRWAEVLLDLLASIYANCAFDRQLTSDRMKLQACESLRAACLAL